MYLIGLTEKSKKFVSVVTFYKEISKMLFVIED